MVDKKITLDQAMEGLNDGMTIAFGGFLGIGSPLRCIERVVKQGVKDLTVIALVNSNPFANGSFELAALFSAGMVKRFITSHNGTCPEALMLERKGELEVELYPQGTLIEKLRAGGYGLGGILTPTGIGTLVEEGKQKVEIDGHEYLVETPIRADLAFIKGYRADTIGNIQYRSVAVNSNPIIAMAADRVIAEVNEIVNLGEISPDSVGTPGIFVDGIVQGMSVQEQQKIYEKLWISGGALESGKGK